jgi:predicted nucleic acid-binding protein
VESVTATHCLDACAVADDAFVQRVGVIKVEEHISFADAFALALAERLHVPLITTDHHEFDAVERKGHFRFMWLR